MFKLFLKPLINFSLNEVFMPKTSCEYRARFLQRLCGATENIWGGGVRDQLSSTIYMSI
jgi:hypothetical protein